MKYKRDVTLIVAGKIYDVLPDKLPIIFDGWNAHDTNYVAIFAIFLASNHLGYDRILRSFSTLHNEASQDAYNHFEYLDSSQVGQ